MSRRNAQITALIALIVAGAAGYGWWTSPERQIRGILDDVAKAFTHNEPGSGLEALTAVAALQKHLALDVTLEGNERPRISGRQEVISSAARIRAGRPMMRVRFFDPRIAFDGDAAATVSVTAEVTTRNDSGEEVVDVHQVVSTLGKSDDRWLVKSARTVSDREPAS